MPHRVHGAWVGTSRRVWPWAVLPWAEPATPPGWSHCWPLSAIDGDGDVSRSRRRAGPAESLADVVAGVQRGKRGRWNDECSRGEGQCFLAGAAFRARPSWSIAMAQWSNSNSERQQETATTMATNFVFCLSGGLIQIIWKVASSWNAVCAYLTPNDWPLQLTGVAQRRNLTGQKKKAVDGSLNFQM